MYCEFWLLSCNLLSLLWTAKAECVGLEDFCDVGRLVNPHLDASVVDGIDLLNTPIC